MRILGLDLATRTGWALWDGLRLESGVQDFSPKRGESAGMRFLYFNRWLADVAAPNLRASVDVIMYEQNFRRGGHASEIAAGFSTRVHELCARFVIEYGQVNVATLKKWATGSGRADKNAMIAAVARYVPMRMSDGKIVLDDNEADAILIAAYAREKFGGNEWNAQPAAAGSIK